MMQLLPPESLELGATLAALADTSLLWTPAGEGSIDAARGLELGPAHDPRQAERGLRWAVGQGQGQGGRQGARTHPSHRTLWRAGGGSKSGGRGRAGLCILVRKILKDSANPPCLARGPGADKAQEEGAGGGGGRQAGLPLQAGSPPSPPIPAPSHALGLRAGRAGCPSSEHGPPAAPSPAGRRGRPGERVARCVAGRLPAPGACTAHSRLRLAGQGLPGPGPDRAGRASPGPPPGTAALLAARPRRPAGLRLAPGWCCRGGKGGRRGVGRRGVGRRGVGRRAWRRPPAAGVGQ
jgi:hypothetical protein